VHDIIHPKERGESWIKFDVGTGQSFINVTGIRKAGANGPVYCMFSAHEVWLWLDVFLPEGVNRIKGTDNIARPLRFTPSGKKTSNQSQTSCAENIQYTGPFAPALRIPVTLMKL
jgi:hypothetical protein